MDTNSRHGSDTALEALVLAGFFILVILLIFKTVPSQNREMVAAALGTLATLAVLVGKSLWERRGATGTVGEIAEAAVDKLPPPTPARHTDVTRWGEPVPSPRVTDMASGSVSAPEDGRSAWNDASKPGRPMPAGPETEILE